MHATANQQLLLIRCCVHGLSHAQPCTSFTSAVMVAHIIDDPLDLVNCWSVLALPKYLTQCSHWLKADQMQIFQRKHTTSGAGLVLLSTGEGTIHLS